MSVSVGVFRRWCTGLVFMQPGVKVNGVYYCDVLLLKQLLPDIYQAAGDFAFQHITRAQERWALWHKTPDFTSDVASQQHRPQFCILQINESFRNAFVRNSKGCQTSPMRCDILLTEWHVIFHKVEGRVEAPIRIGGQLRYSSVANLLQSVCQKISKI